MLEELLAYHCAPAFAGIKPANIVSCSKAKYGSLHRDIETLNRQLNPKDIFIRILCECERRALVMVYRKSILTSHLQTECNKTFLSRYGYPQDGTLSDYLEILSKRLDCESFPHEIGVFLGYPLYDIDCFRQHRDEGCLLVGEWKG